MNLFLAYVVVYALIGLAPLVFGIKKGVPKIGFAAFILCILAGLILPGIAVLVVLGLSLYFINKKAGSEGKKKD